MAKRHSSSPPPDEESTIVIDPQAGGQVVAKAKAQHKALEARSGQWVWAGLTKVLSVDIFR
jgi:TATA-binding protein-associated factor